LFLLVQNPWEPRRRRPADPQGQLRRRRPRRRARAAAEAEPFVTALGKPMIIAAQILLGRGHEAANNGLVCNGAHL